MNELVPGSQSVPLSASLSQFEGSVMEAAAAVGLPVTRVVAAEQDRITILSNMQSAINRLSEEQRSEALYMSKFIYAVASGLLDAALNYLWDETINQLRQRIVNYGVEYFFDQSGDSPNKRDELNGPEDLEKIADAELLQTAQKVGFISSVGLIQLQVVREMRNHASAAHPNLHQLTPFVLLGYLEACINEVICQTQSPILIEVSTLLRNIKTSKDIVTSHYERLLTELPPSQREALGKGLFGIYSSKTALPTCRNNVRKIFPVLWDGLEDGARYGLGVRYWQHKLNADDERAELSMELLRAASGLDYLPEDYRSAEIKDVLIRLRSVHDSYDNFYNEPPLARQLSEVVGSKPVPDEVAEFYSQTLTDLFLGNPSGKSWRASEIYESLIAQFSPSEALFSLQWISGEEAAGKLQFKKPGDQFYELLDILEGRIVDPYGLLLYAALQGFNGTPGKMYLESRVRKARSKIGS